MNQKLSQINGWKLQKDARIERGEQRVPYKERDDTASTKLERLRLSRTLWSHHPSLSLTMSTASPFARSPSLDGTVFDGNRLAYREQTVSTSMRVVSES